MSIIKFNIRTMKFRSFKINDFDNINIGDYSNVKIIINIFFVFLILITNIFRNEITDIVILFSRSILIFQRVESIVYIYILHILGDKCKYE